MLFLVIVMVCLCSQAIATIEITSPQRLDKVSWRTKIDGQITPFQNDTNVYVLIWSTYDKGPYYVYEADLLPNGSWMADAKVGRDPRQFSEDIGGTYRIIAIETNETISYGQIDEIPGNAIESKKIDVDRSSDLYPEGY